MPADWPVSDKLALLGLVVAAIGLPAVWLAVPGVSEWIMATRRYLWSMLTERSWWIRGLTGAGFGAIFFIVLPAVWIWGRDMMGNTASPTSISVETIVPPATNDSVTGGKMVGKADQVNSNNERTPDMTDFKDSPKATDNGSSQVNTMGNIVNNTGIVTQGQTGNNTIINTAPAARHLKEGDKSALIESLSQFNGQKVKIVSVFGDSEGDRYKGEFLEVLQKAKWSFTDHDVLSVMMRPVPEGVQVTVNPDDAKSDGNDTIVLHSAAVLSKMLHNLGITSANSIFTNPGVPKDTISLVIGTKPND
jgi:hypothetical protein